MYITAAVRNICLTTIVGGLILFASACGRVSKPTQVLPLRLSTSTSSPTLTISDTSDPSPNAPAPLEPAILSPLLQGSIGKFYSDGRTWIDRFQPALRFHPGVALTKWFDARIRYVVDDAESRPDLDPDARAHLQLSHSIETMLRTHVPFTWTPNFEGPALQISSAHQGVLQIKSPLVRELQSFPLPARELLGPIMLWAALLHEARHTDGTGSNRFHLHVLCPTSMPEVGDTMSCDAVDGRSYSIEADWLHWANAHLEDLAAADPARFAAKLPFIRVYLSGMERELRARILAPTVYDASTDFESL